MGDPSSDMKKEARYMTCISNTLNYWDVNNIIHILLSLLLLLAVIESNSIFLVCILTLTRPPGKLI